jgi:excinuclease ABC subunit B
MYADKITGSMQQTLDETARRREKQLKYNEENNITPVTVFKSKEDIMQSTSVLNIRISPDSYVELEEEMSVAAEPDAEYMNADQLHKAIEAIRKKMLEASKETDFLTAAKLRDQMISMQKTLKEKFGK